jgi:signal peptidase I
MQPGESAFSRDKDKRKMAMIPTLRRNLLLILLAFSPLLFLVVIAPSAMVVPTGAMENTLLIGDHVIVNLAAYGIPANGSVLFGRGPRRGDVIVLLYPLDITQVFVKRVIGVPGDRIRIVNKQLFLNGRKVDTLATIATTRSTAATGVSFPARILSESR